MEDTQAKHPMEQAFANELDMLGVARAGEIVVIALSGGADSVALLRLFCALREARGLQLHAAHLNHGIRGIAAEEDAAFVQTLCAHLRVPCTMGTADVPARSRQLKTGLEDAARQERYTFLEGVRFQTGATYIALAHHMEDQAETVLLHLARGTGLAGLTGMRALQGRLLRPLLGVRRGALRGYLSDIGQSWREDATNNDPTWARNHVRLRVLPELSRLNPSVVETIAGMAERLTWDEQCLQAELASLGLSPAKETPYGAYMEHAGLAAAPEALRRRALRGVLAQHGPEGIEAAHIRALSKLVLGRPGEGCNLPQGWHAWRGLAHLHVMRPEANIVFQRWAVPLRHDGVTELPSGARMIARPAVPGELGDGVRTQVLDEAALHGAVIRVRLPGDAFHPLGATGSQSLKKALMDRHVDRPFRALTPLIAVGARILWIVGVLPSAEAAVAQDTKQAIHLTYEGDIPWGRGS